MKLTQNPAFWKKLFEKRVSGYKVKFVKKRPILKWTRRGFLLAIPLYAIWCWYHYGKLTDDQDQPLDFEKLRNNDFYKASYVYDINGHPIGRFFYEARDYIKLNEIPKLVQQAFIAAEDQRFYSWLNYFGVDPLAILRAGIYNTTYKYTGYGTRSGASGIHQQEVRQLFGENVADFKNRVQTFPRKIREARVAVTLNSRYTKDEVLEGFLNLPYFGYGANGVVEAWQVYFNKNLRRDPVTIREVAIIAALNKSPEKFSPIYHPPQKLIIAPDADEKTRTRLENEYKAADAVEIVRIARARERNNYVIERMYKEGFISFEDFEREKFKKGESLNLDIIHFTPISKKHFVYANRMIKEFLIFNGIDDEEITKYAGLKIYSTIDSSMQQILTEEVNKQLAEFNRELPINDQIEGSFIVVDVKTGEIRAISGGHEDISQMQYNRVLARRSPGSAIKPFVYATALEEGRTFDDFIKNSPLRMIGAKGKIWAPQNFREEHPVPIGLIPLPIGFIRSVNLPTIQMILNIEGGVEKFIKLAHSCGIWANRNVLKDSDGIVWFKYLSSLEEHSSNDLDEGLVPKLPTVIGASGVSLVELAAGYGVFARNGKYIRPTLIKEVEDLEGQIWLKPNKPEEKRVITEKTAKMITIMGRAVTKFGTLKISMRGIEQQIAGKTGTSNTPGLNIYDQPSEGPADAMVASWNPEYVILIRFGHDKLRSIEVPQYMKRVSGRADMQVSGGWLVGPVVRKAWDRIYAKKVKVPFSNDIEAGTTELIEKYGTKY